jgi:N-hydroxyarylamine O-acetyltransferase
VDPAAYFGRIGYTGEWTPTLATLQAIHALHPAAIPFENLDPLLRRPVKLDLPSLEAKLVGGQRGGYCFEHNLLLRAALQALGFRVTSLSARVRWMRPPDNPEAARSHMLLRVDLDAGPYLVDVGFGGYLLPAPMKMERDLEQPNAHGVVRLVGDDSSLTLQAALPSGWQDLYRFTQEPSVDEDYVSANWFTATYPGSLFLSNLLVQRVGAKGRYSLFNKRLTRRGRTGTLEESTLENAEELAVVLQTLFGLELPAPAVEIWGRLP